MIGTVAQDVRTAIEAATPWLDGTAMGFFVLWITCKAKPFGTACSGHLTT